MPPFSCALAGRGTSSYAPSREWGTIWLIHSRPVSPALVLGVILALGLSALAARRSDDLAADSPAAISRSPRVLPPASRVIDIHTESNENGVRLVVKTDGAMVFKPFTLANPWRIVIDVEGVRNAAGNPLIAVTSPLVRRVRVGQPQSGIVRIVIETPTLTAYTVDFDDDNLTITIGKHDSTKPADLREKAAMRPVSQAATEPAETASSLNTHTVYARESPVAAGVAANPKPSAGEAPRQPGLIADDDHAAVSRLLRRVEELEARVHELEGKPSPTPPAPAVEAKTAPSPPKAPAADPVAVNTPASAGDPSMGHNSGGHNSGGHDGHGVDQDVPHGRPSLQLQGFADVDYRATTHHESNNAFQLGQLDLFITSRLADKFTVLSELIVQAGLDNAFSFEIHRLLLQYYPNDYFNLSVGRYHSAIGYYNTAYHHGQWFQTAATRPFIFAFEGQGGILPLHNVGLSVTGRIPSGSLGLRYVAEIGNGRSVNSPGDRAVQTSNDENQGKSVNFGLLMRPEWALGLQMGVSVYRDRLTPTGKPNVDQTITAAHVVYRNANYEWLNEALLLRHAPLGGARVFNTPAFYTQFAKRFGNAWPYFRYDYLNVPESDPIFAAVGRRNGPAAGLRYELTEFAAFKVQYDHVLRRRQTALDELLLQLAFTF